MKKFLTLPSAALFLFFTACSDDSSSGSSSGTVKATCDYDSTAGYYFCDKDENGNYTYAIDEDDIIYLTANSESSSSTCFEEESSSSVCSELSVDCLRGSWTFSHFFDAETSTYAEPNALTFNSCQEFTYTPSSNDASHTYCMGFTLTGTYELSGTDTITFHAGKDGSTTLAGLCFLDSVGTATIADDGVTRTLSLTGIYGYPLFVPNDEGAVTEVYVKD